MTEWRSHERYGHDGGLIRVSSRKEHPSKTDATACLDFLIAVLSAHQIRKIVFELVCNF